MGNDTYQEPTIFDTLTQCREIQMLKTAVPYVKQTKKRQFAILIKYLELQRAMQIFTPGAPTLSACEIPNEQKNSLNMLTEMRKYATPREQDLIDNFTGLISMMTLYSDVL